MRNAQVTLRAQGSVFQWPRRGLCADRLPGEAGPSLDRNDCANKERGGLQEPSLGPKPPVNETSQGERAARVSGGWTEGAAEQLEASNPEAVY